MLSAAVTRVKRMLGSAASDPEQTAGRSRAEADDGPDLFECTGCGSVFISRPSECSECGTADFSNVGKFD